jgi:hypothetical protein
LQGYFRFLFLYEAAEAIRLDTLRPLLQRTRPDLQSSLPDQVPSYVQFERPPVVEPIIPISLGAQERIEGRTRYYDCGVVSIELELPFECDWKSLVAQSSRWIGSADLQSEAYKLLQTALSRGAPALVKPYDRCLREDYYITHVLPIAGADGRTLPAESVLADHAQEIAQVIRGESMFLSDGECREVLQSSISYSQADLLVVGWTSALAYGTSEGVATTIQLLEYANVQLLEFRHYDSLLARLLDEVYRTLERKRGVLAAWRLSREAARLNTIRLDVMELTEKLDNAIKFLSDMFYARLYGLAAARVGVPDYRRLVDQKLRTAGEQYRFMVEQFNQTRSFVLELGIVIILVIDLFFLFRGG